MNGNGSTVRMVTPITDVTGWYQGLTDPNGPLYQRELESAFSVRRYMLEELGSRHQATQQLALQGGTPVPMADADKAANRRGLMGVLNALITTDPQESRRRDLLGIAHAHGITGAEQWDEEQLRYEVQRRRMSMDEMSMGANGREKLWDVVGSAAGYAMVGFSEGALDVAMNLPLVGTILERMPWAREADMKLSEWTEMARSMGSEVAGLTNATAQTDLTEGLVTAVPYIAASHYLWRGMQTTARLPAGFRVATGATRLGRVRSAVSAARSTATPAIGGSLPPIAKGALAGAIDAWMLEGGDAEARQKHMLMGAVAGGFLETGMLPVAGAAGGIGGAMLGHQASDGDWRATLLGGAAGAGVAIGGVLGARALMRKSAEIFPSASQIGRPRGETSAELEMIRRDRMVNRVADNIRFEGARQRAGLQPGQYNMPGQGPTRQMPGVVERDAFSYPGGPSDFGTPIGEDLGWFIQADNAAVDQFIAADQQLASLATGTDMGARGSAREFEFLDSFGVRADRRIQGEIEVATQAAQAHSKRTQLLTADSAPQFGAQPLDDYSVAQATREHYPGQTTVVNGVGDINTFMRRAMEDGIDPASVRAVTRNGTDHIIMGHPSTVDQLASEFEQWGVFTGQHVGTPGGHEAVVQSVGQIAKVRHPYFEGFTYDVPVSKLSPKAGSMVHPELRGRYNEFRDYAQSRLMKETSDAGLVGAPDEFSDVMSANSQRYMEDFLEANGITDAADVALHNLAFNKYRTGDLMLGVGDPGDLGTLYSMMAEAAEVSGAAAQRSLDFPASIHELAPAKGVKFTPNLRELSGSQPEWLREGMLREGLRPDRMFNDVDIQNPSVREAISMDPSLTPEQVARTLATGDPRPTERRSQASLSQRELAPELNDVAAFERVAQRYMPQTAPRPAGGPEPAPEAVARYRAEMARLDAMEQADGAYGDLTLPDGSRVSVATHDEAVEFLRNYEPPQTMAVKPTLTPDEIIVEPPIGPGGATSSDSYAGGFDDMDLGARVMDDAAADIEAALDDAEISALERGDPMIDTDWGGEHVRMTQDEFLRLGGGADGAPPNRNLPRVQGGGAGDPNHRPFKGSHVNGKFDFLYDRLNSNIFRVMTPARKQMLELEEAFHLEGVNFPIHKHYRDFSQAKAVANNEAEPWLKRARDVVSTIDPSLIRKGMIPYLVQRTPESLVDEALRLGVNKRSIDGILELKRFLNDARKYATDRGLNVGFLTDYWPAFKRAESWEQIADKLPDSDKWFALHMRDQGFSTNADPSTVLSMYVRGMTSELHVRPQYEKFKGMLDDARELGLKDLNVRDKAVGTEVFDLLTGWLNLAYRGAGLGDSALAPSVQKMFNTVGIPVNKRDVNALLGGMHGNLYRAYLGHNVSAVVRDLYQTAFTGAELGFKHVGDVISDYARNPAAREAMTERALRMGWVDKSLVQLDAADVIDSANIGGTGDMTLSEPLRRRRESFLNLRAQFRDLLPPTMRKGFKGSKLDPIKPYASVGHINRILSGEAGYRKALGAIDSYRSVPSEQRNLAKLMSESGASRFHPTLSREFETLFRNGQFDEAAQKLGYEAANSQLRYGTREQPEWVRNNKTMGRAFMMFGNFTNQFTSRFLDGLRYGTVADRVGFGIRYGALSGGIALAAHETGWTRLNRFRWESAATFAGGPGFAAAYGGLQYTTGRAAQLTGQNMSPEQQFYVSRGLPGIVPWEATNPFYGTGRTLTGFAGAASAPAHQLEQSAYFGVTGGRQPDFINNREFGSQQGVRGYVSGATNINEFMDGLLRSRDPNQAPIPEDVESFMQMADSMWTARQPGGGSR